MSDFDRLIQELKQKRDELRLQMHLASKEAKDEWEELEEKMEDFSSKAKQFSKDAKIEETGEGLSEALGKVGHELKLGYERLRKAIKD
jgi:vacuolar-type H+-ATPase subunit D/Vma8